MSNVQRRLGSSVASRRRHTADRPIEPGLNVASSLVTKPSASSVDLEDRLLRPTRIYRSDIVQQQQQQLLVLVPACRFFHLPPPSANGALGTERFGSGSGVGIRRRRRRRTAAALREARRRLSDLPTEPTGRPEATGSGRRVGQRCVTSAYVSVRH
jgi:hypothetical protein